MSFAPLSLSLFLSLSLSLSFYLSLSLSPSPPRDKGEKRIEDRGKQLGVVKKNDRKTEKKRTLLNRRERGPGTEARKLGDQAIFQRDCCREWKNGRKQSGRGENEEGKRRGGEIAATAASNRRVLDLVAVGGWFLFSFPTFPHLFCHWWRRRRRL